MPGTMPAPFDDALQHLPPDALRPWAGNARTHSKKQLRQIADSIRTFGFTNPVLIDETNTILAGHGRVAAARMLGLATVPCRLISTMSAAQKRAYVLADNKLALNAGWDEEMLATELSGLLATELDFDLGVTGFYDPGDRQPDRRARPRAAGRPGRRPAAGCGGGTGGHPAGGHLDPGRAPR